jgi:type VI secretion system secreted protein Hcp
MAIYVKFEGVDGDATEAEHKQWMDVQSVQMGVGRGIHTPVGSAANREASEPSVSEVTLTMTMDRSSTKMFEESCVGKLGKEVTIDFCTTGNPAELYLQYKLHKVLVSGYSVSSGGDRPSVSVSYNFSKVEMKYIPTDEKNEPLSPLLAGFDIGEGKKV